jgi:hypothetical protein
MTSCIFFFNQLSPGVNPSDYESWVRAVDYPRVETLRAVSSYTVVRIENHLRGDQGPLPSDYLEVVEVTDLEQYRAELATMPGREEFVAQLNSYVSNSLAVYGTAI